MKAIGDFTPGRSRTPAGDMDAGTLRLRAVCPNPDCPNNESDLAPLADR